LPITSRRDAAAGCACTKKDGKEHEAPCHHKLEAFLDEYIAAAGIRNDKAGPLFRTTGRATGITDYLKSDGTLEHAEAMANHSSPRTTKFYDRRGDEVSLDEYRRVGI
jgi:integrase/recombinase XerC